MNGALALLVRRSLRTNRRAILGLALVVALSGAVALTSLAAARRTASTFARYQESSHASEVALNLVSASQTEDTDASPSAPILEAARGLPHVVSTASYIGLEGVGVFDDDGSFFDIQPEVLGSIDGRFLDQDQVAVSQGRVPRSNDPDEVFLNEDLARGIGAHIGSTLHLAVVPLDQLQDRDPEDLEPVAFPEPTVVGIGRLPDEVLGDDIDASGRLLMTPAFTRQWRDVAGTYIWQGLRLTSGASVDEAIADYQTLLPPDLQVNVQRSDVQHARVQRAVRPVVVALAAFGIAAGLAALALGALGIVRLVATGRGDVRTLRALGLGRGGTASTLGVAAFTACAAGVVGAVALAWALSPLAPVGPVRRVEPDRGVDLDSTVLLFGGLLLLVVLVLTVLLAARQALAGERTGAEATARPSRVVARFAGLGFGPTAVVGARHAMGDGRRGGPPARSTLAACTVAVGAIAAALTFGASVRSLLDTPAQYGWPITVALQSGGGYDEVDVDQGDTVADLDGVEALTIGGFAPIVVHDQRINAIGIVPVEGDPTISVVRGQVPEKVGEVALGASTARDLHVGVGDELEAEGGRLRVTGIVALPAIGPLASAHPSLGQGALLTFAGLQGQDDTAYASVAFLRLASGIDPLGNGKEMVGAAYATLTGYPADAAEAYPLMRPAEVLGLQPATRTANLLAGLLAGAAVLALALSLTASVRRRTSTYAVLSSLGFSRRDIRRTVRWHTNLVTVLSLAIGLPAGAVAGRLAWTAFADQLGAAGGPRVPVLLLAGAAVAILVLSNLVAEWPARQASRRSGTRLLAISP